ncbi:MAG: hypothetical protein [Microviridae sp.]|nr:MAG: hypothetical protein [Microviridae sp.]
MRHKTCMFRYSKYQKPCSRLHQRIMFYYGLCAKDKCKSLIYKFKNLTLCVDVMVALVAVVKDYVPTSYLVAVSACKHTALSW